MPYEALRQDKVNVLVASNSIRQEKPVHRFDRAFASGKCDLFVGNPVPNVRLVGVYLGTFRGCVYDRALCGIGVPVLCGFIGSLLSPCRRGLEGDGH